jgi:hypothetical protein
MSLKELLKEDIYWNCTPDVATLRYCKSEVCVFLWDDMKDTETFETYCNGVVANTDYEVISPTAVSKSKHLPWYELKGNTGFNAYCLEDALDVEYLKCDEHVKGEPLQLRGSLVRVTLDTLLHLDWNYENQHSFIRVPIEVHQSPFHTKPYIGAKVYTYMNTLDQVSDFCPETHDFKFKPKFDFTPFSNEKSNNKELYKY